MTLAYLQGTRSVAARQGKLYAATALGLEVYDLAALDEAPAGQAPAPVWWVELAGVPADLTWRDDLVAVASGVDGVMLFDVSDDSNPVVFAEIPTRGAATGVALLATGVVLAGEFGVTSVDLSAPSTPSRHPALELAGVIGNVEVSQGFAFVAAGPSGVHVVDMTQAESPALVTTLETSGFVGRVRIFGSTLFVASQYDGVYLYDITSPGAPALLGGYLGTSGSLIAYDVAVNAQASQMVVAASYGGTLHVVDIGDPAHPAAVGSVNANTVATSLAWTPTAVYVAGTALLRASIDAPSAPSITAVWGMPTRQAPAALATDGDLLLMGHSTGLSILDADAGTELAEVAFFPTEHPILSTLLHETTAYIGLDTTVPFVISGRIQVVSLDDPQVPVARGWLTAALRPADLALSGAVLYATGSALQVIDVSNPDAPTQLSTLTEFNPGWTVDALDVRGSLLAAAAHYKGVFFFDISDPSAPKYTGSVATSGLARDVVMDEHFAYLADGPRGIIVISVDDPSHPVRVGTVSLPANVDRVVLSDGPHLWATVGGEVFAFATTADGRLLPRQAWPSASRTPTALCARAGGAFVSDQYNPLAALAVGCE